MSEDEDFRRGVRPRSDSSSSDGSVGPSNSRNKRVRVAVESDGSESSGGPVSRRGRTRAAPLRDSDTDTSGWATDHSDAPMPTAPPRNDGFASDSSEGNSDKCSICLLRFTNQEIGVPQTCEHYFCLDCITEWSKNVNTCPVDRKEFDAIVVKLCVGGPVLRTEPVHVAERRSSVDIVVVEEHTICQLCHSPESEETMLLCDGCDLGYHMACLEPPLITIPRGQWFCPYCISDSEDGDVPISEVTDLLDDLDNEGLAARPLPPRSHILRAPRNVRRSRRSRGADQPSSSRQRNSNITNEGSTSRSRKRTRKRVKGRPSRRVPGMLEDEVSSGRARTQKRRVRRKVVRTAARRAMVRGCVRARLATLRDQDVMRTDPTDINVSRHRAGILPLSIFGSQFELEYFGEGEEGGGGGTVAMATRPTSHIISAYRQAQRKQITIPSPTHASTAPDILSSILESQSLLHSKGSIVSVSAGGQVNIKLIQKRPKNPGSIQPNVPKPTENEPIANKENADASGVKLDNKDDINKNVSDRVDLVKAGTSVNVKETPMHPSQSRGGGFNHQNNYRGHGNFNNGGRHYDNNYGGDFNRNSQGNSFQDNVYNDGNSFEGSYDRRPGFDGGYRPRRPYEENRPFQRFNEPGRHSFGPPWQTSNQNRNQYQNNPRPNIEPRARHSFGGLEDPLDMRTGPNNFPPSSSNNISIINSSNNISIINSSNNISIINSSNSCAPTNTNIPPLREPPAFKFNVNTEVEKSEDENDGLVIDTEKYDPTEPTVDEESENEDEQLDLFPEKSADITESITETVSEDIPLPQEPVPNESLDKPVNISAAALDDAVRQVIRQHSRLLTNEQDSDEEDTGDCPNFSIYSATSVHIAQTTNIEDTPAIETANLSTAAEVIKPPDAYNVKISKKCPITPNTRTPIKIKINTPSLIKRVSLYDEEDEQEEEEVEEPPKETPNVIESPVEELTKNKNFLPVTNEVSVPDVEMENVKAKSVEREKSPDRIIQSLQIYDDDDKSDRTPIEDEKDSPIIENTLSNNDNYFKTPERDLPPSDDEKSIASNKSTKFKQSQSESDQGEQSDSCLPKTPKKKPPLEKMTESISETEDERSYTPCLDENKKENSIEADALQGLDTEMISEDEAQDTFLEIPKEQEVIEEAPKPEEEKEAPVKKKKKEVKEKKSKKKSESFKKSGKTKTRNYRDKDKNRSRSPSHEKGDKGKSKREKRKDLERYDVRNVVSEKRRRKDAFGRDIISPRRSGSPVSPTRKRRSSSPIRRSLSRPKRSVSRPLRSTSRVRRSISRTRRSISRTKRSLTPRPRRSPVRAGRSISRRRSISRLKRSLSRQIRSLSRQRRSLSRKRVSPPPRRHSPPFRRRSLSRGRVSPSRTRGSPSRARGSPSRARVSPVRSRVSPVRTRVSPARHKRRRSSSPHKRRVSLTSPTRDTLRKKKKSVSPRRKSSTRKEKRRKETELKTKPSKKKKRDRSQSKEKKRRNRKKSESPKRKSPKRKKKRRSVVEEPIMEVEPVWVWSGGSVASERSESRPPSPLTPPNPVLPQHSHHRHRRVRDPPPSKEVFTSGDNILVSVSFKDSNSTAALEERKRQRAERRLRRLAVSSSSQPLQEPKPVAIIDLERSPFREITPEAVHVIVVSDGDKSPDERREPVGPKTPPESECARAPPCLAAAPPGSTGGGAGGVSAAPLAPLATLSALPALPSLAAAQYDPFEPTRSPSISSNAGDKEVSGPTEAGLNAGPLEQDRLAITLETAQKTNMSADEVLDQRPISPIEKVMALLKSTRDVSLECVPASSPMQLPATPPPSQNPPTPPPVTPLPTLTTLPSVPAATPRVLLPSPSRSSPLRPQPSKLFLAKPSPIKSTPIKPMPATKISSLPLPVVRRVGEESPYSPASSDFGELFSPPGGKDAFDALTAKKKKSDASKVPVKRVKKKGGKHQVPVQLGDDNLKILDDLPSSAVEMQVKSKFLKKLNRQERVVEEVKLVLKPYYNRRRLSKDDYKDIMRRAVPKICHNKHGEINPTKIQSLVEAYVKKLRKKRKLGLS